MNSRRSFLQSTAALAALGPFAPWQALAAATGDGGGGSYRALVCLFMFGGSDV